jgi:hypothetical protein
MVLDSDGESRLGSEEGGLEADCIQEGAKGVALLAPRGHVGDEFPLAEEG